VIILGALLAVWGAIVLAFARPLHSGWKEMLRGMRRAGVRDSVWGTEWIASAAGLRGMRIAGGVVLAAGLALLAAGGVRALLST
jgi:hypothetical protein